MRLSYDWGFTNAKPSFMYAFWESVDTILKENQINEIFQYQKIRHTGKKEEWRAMIYSSF